MKTIMNSRRAFISAAAGIALAFFVGVTACQQDGSTSPIAALDDLNSSSSSLSASAVSGSLTSDDSDLDLASGLNIMALAGGSETRPEAVLEINRRRLSSTSTETGGEASARFDNTLGVTGVSVAVLGTTYQFVTPPMRPNNGNGRGPGGNGNGNPNSTNANAPRPDRIASTLFVFPAPPSTTSTTTPALITLSPANAVATFTVNGYTLGDNTLGIPGTVSFTSLKSGDALSRTSNLTVRWSVAGTFTNGVVVLKNVLDSTALDGKTRREIEQIRRNLPKPITKQLTAGAASVDFTAAELTALQAGSAEITVGIVNAKRTNSDKAILIARTHTGARITLQ